LAVNAAKIADATITNAKITDSTITGAKIANATIEEGNIANAAITNAKIASAAIKEGNIDNLAVTNAKIALATITGAKIANATIETGNIANAAITNAKIGDLQVDTIKIANGAVSSTQVQGLSLGWNFEWSPGYSADHTFDLRFWVPVSGNITAGYINFEATFTAHMHSLGSVQTGAMITVRLQVINESVPGGQLLYDRDLVLKKSTISVGAFQLAVTDAWWQDARFSNWFWIPFNSQILFRLTARPYTAVMAQYITGGNFAYDHFKVGVSTLYK